MKKILIFTVNGWTSLGGTYTFSSLFENIPDVEIANIYIRDVLPDSNVARRYFQISERKIIKSIFKRKIKTGTEVEQKVNSLSTENVQYWAAPKKNKTPFIGRIIREILWKLGKWNTKELNDFIDSFKPDVIVYAMEGYIHLNRIVRHAIKRSGARAIGFFWDDNFTYKQYNKLSFKFLRKKQRNDLKKCVKVTDEFWAISPKTKDEADAFFNIKCTLLTRPLNKVSPYIKTDPNFPLKIVYTGNLLIGRDDSLSALISALRLVNKEKTLFTLDIYSQTILDEKYLKKNNEPWVKFNGTIPQDQVNEKQEDADILLLLEDINGVHKNAARLSFSTKIVDYLTFGKLIFAVAKRDLASMDYLLAENAAIVADAKTSIVAELNRIVTQPETINEVGMNAYNLGINKHNRQLVNEIIISTISRLIDKER